MPLIDAEAPPTQADDTYYVAYLGSGEPSWCPDCRDAHPTLEHVFGPASAPSVYIVRVDKADWKGLSGEPCRYRGEPYNIQSLPTVVKVVNGREIGRRGDDRHSEEDLRGLIASE